MYSRSRILFLAFILSLFFFGCNNPDIQNVEPAVLPTETVLAPTVPSLTTMQVNQTQNAAHFATGSTQLTATWIALPTQTETPTPAPTQVQQPAIIPFSSPLPAPESYRLREWTEQDALDLISAEESYALYVLENPPPSAFRGEYAFQEAHRSIKVAVQEALLKFPNIDSDGMLAWKVAHANAILSWPAEINPDDWILSTLETDLNSGKVTVDTIESYFRTRSFYTLQRMQIPGLMGGTQLVEVFWISATDSSFADGLLFSVQHNAGQYELIKVYSSWNYYYGSFERFIYEDHNFDGLPEIYWLMSVYNGSMCGSKFGIFQWEENQFVDLAVGPGSPNGIDLACDAQWNFDRLDENGVPLLSILQGWPFGTLSENDYKWNGTRYERIEIRFTPPEYYETYPRDWLGYAVENGDYTTATQKLEEALLHWNSDSFPWVGPAFKDFVRFQLAYLYALQSQPDRARAGFQELSVAPADGTKLTISKATEAFLSEYDQDEDIYSACSASLASMAEPLLPFQTEDGYFPFEKVEEYWGYAPSINEFSICSLRAAFRLLLSRYNPLEDGDLLAYLETRGVKIYASVQTDLDQDNRKDLLILVETPNEEAEIEIWALLRNENSFLPFALTDFQTGGYDLGSFSEAQGVFEPAFYDLPGSNKPIVILHARRYLLIFEIINGQAETPSVRVIDSYREVDSYAVQPTNEQVILTIDYSEIWDDEVYLWQRIYHWEPLTRAFIYEKEIDLSDPNPALAWDELAIQLETDLFLNTDLSKTLLLLEENLSVTPEYCDEICQRLYYFLALSYQLSGNEQRAIETYWQLWHDYPDSPYAIMSQAKLGPISP